MADMDPVKERVKEQFGKHASDYVKSKGHAYGQDLARIVEWIKPHDKWICLDVATGGGHVAKTLAPITRMVIATDITEQMLMEARKFHIQSGIGNILYLVADAENLPFIDHSFDLVVCRIAPHHFQNKQKFLHEVARVMNDEGLFIMIDNVAPEDESLNEMMNTFEKLRDTSHVRCESISVWKDMLARSGLKAIREETVKKTYEFRGWAERTASHEGQIHEVETFIGTMPRYALDYFNVKKELDRIDSLDVDQWMVMCRKNIG